MESATNLKPPSTCLRGILKQHLLGQGPSSWLAHKLVLSQSLQYHTLYILILESEVYLCNEGRLYGPRQSCDHVWVYCTRTIYNADIWSKVYLAVAVDSLCNLLF